MNNYRKDDETRARLMDLADRYDMASKRMAEKTGKADLDLYRDGLREAYFQASRDFKEAADLLGSVPLRQLMVDRDADLLRELRAYLDTRTITSDNIGKIRRALFMPWDSSWNGWVRDETAAREKPSNELTHTPGEDE